MGKILGISKFKFNSLLDNIPLSKFLNDIGFITSSAIYSPQILSIAGNQISISDANTISLPTPSKIFYNGVSITNATATMIAIPALSFNVEVGWYRVKFYPFYNSVNTATGVGFNLGSGTAIRTNQTLKAEIHTTTTAMQIFNYSNLAQNYTNTASPRITDNRACVEAHFQVTAAGTIIPMFRSENTGLITLRAGSYLTYEKIN